MTGIFRLSYGFFVTALSLAALGCSGLRTEGTDEFGFLDAFPVLAPDRNAGGNNRGVIDQAQNYLEQPIGAASVPESKISDENDESLDVTAAVAGSSGVSRGQEKPSPTTSDRVDFTHEDIEQDVLPKGYVFRPLIADMKEPQFSLAYRRVRFRGQGLPAEGEGSDINVGIVALGGTFDLWKLKKPWWDFAAQVGLFGGVFSQFNLDTRSTDLINSDYQAGFPLTLRWGMFSSRLRLFHQSSHLGDEFLLRNPGVDREDLSFETVDGLFAAEGKWWRLYGGGGYIFHSKSDLDRGLLQWGVELLGPTLPWEGPGQSRLRPIFGADFNSLEERDWDVTTSLKGGLEWGSAGETRRVRLLAVYLDGSAPFSQFFNTVEIESFGVELQFLF